MEVLFDPHPIPPSDEGGRVKKGEKNEILLSKDLKSNFNFFF